MYESERYRNLSGTAKDVYTGIVMNCNKDYRDRCKFPKSAYINRCSKQAFHKAICDLNEAGFIEIVCCQKRANIYFLSEDWKLEIVPRKETKYVSPSEYYKLL